MSSLSFPDVNVWMALIYEHHAHRRAAAEWFRSVDGDIAFMRVTQMSVLRLVTTAAAMNGVPLSMDEAWAAYDRLFEDSRVCFWPEPAEFNLYFRRFSAGRMASPKVWADAYLLAFCAATGGELVTFDRTLGDRAGKCTVLR